MGGPVLGKLKKSWKKDKNSGKSSQWLSENFNEVEEKGN
jgi:hypothetical protein